jgi:hypothetical protein
VVKGEHHSAAVLRIEDLAEAVLEAPVILVAALEEEARGFLGVWVKNSFSFLSAALVWMSAMVVGGLELSFDP